MKVTVTIIWLFAVLQVKHHNVNDSDNKEIHFKYNAISINISREFFSSEPDSNPEPHAFVQA